ncbi:P-loop containing nucleoside triphosphate hydrolase protein [Morchella snyderi]|nr:P-loop containing nucleoside triphosphate hydrolase protein [Morchella snyderi]
MSMSSNNIVSPPGTPVRPPMMTIENRSFLDVASHLHHPLRTHASSASLRSREPTPQRNFGEGNRGGNVRVVVRVRGFLPREIERGATNLIEMDPRNQTTILHPPPESVIKTNSRKIVEKKEFTFDNSFWSFDRRDDHYADQEDVYNALGEEFLDHNFEGYHTCIFAYGQTGAGKSYSMMGTPEHPGLIPRTCRDLFERIESNNSPSVNYSVRVSYFEVYNEHVCDLLVPRRETPYYLKVRESPTEGPYIKDLTEVPVRNIGEILKWMKMGDNNRTIASTKMNDTSSRSHAVFTLVLKQIHHDMDTDETTERVARIRLVDLAGSERANSTGATGVRLREGSNINKSLTTLGRVIAALADDVPTKAGRKKREVVPYRDSILTWLLKDSLGGNSKTAMIACISPSDYEETLSTLRYADQAKRIRTRAIINQDHVSAAERDAQIAEMQETIRNLQISVSQVAQTKKENDRQNEQLEMYQNEVEKMQRKMEEARQVAECKIKALQTQNEALRLHLRLAIESLKNPIPAVLPPSRRTSIGEGGEEQLDDEEEYDEEEYDESEEESKEEEDEERDEMESRLADLLQDLGVFRRKVSDDKGRFLEKAYIQEIPADA